MGLLRDHLATTTPETGNFQPEGRLREEPEEQY